jgi:ferredoxin
MLPIGNAGIQRASLSVARNASIHAAPGHSSRDWHAICGEWLSSVSPKRVMHAAGHAAQQFQPVARHARLQPAAPLGFCAGACIAAHASSPACSRCAETCPTAALRVGAAGPRLEAECSGCGLCVAACPSGALAADGFDVLQAPPPEPRLRIVCERASPAALTSGGCTVPCLGGVKPSDLLRPYAESAYAAVVLHAADCSGCGRAGVVAPGEACVQGVRALLTQLGIATTDLPRIERAGTSAPPRRAFFGRAARELATLGARRAGVALDLSPRGAPAARRAGVQLPERRAQLASAAAIARRNGRPLPAGLFHELQVDTARCVDHGVCAALCPTRALTRFEAGGRAGLRFDALACIGCGRCASVCPEGALSSRPAARVPILDTREVVTHALRECIDCGAGFRVADEELSCPHCRKRGALARAGFLLRRGASVPLSPSGLGTETSEH